MFILDNKNKKLKIIIVSAISATILCSIIVLASLSPISNSGPNVNQFGDIGMWMSIVLILISYVIPLIIYSLGVDAFKYVMAALCGLGLLIGMAVIFTTILFIFTSTTSMILYALLCLSVLYIMSNIIWIFITFSTSNKNKKP